MRQHSELQSLERRNWLIKLFQSKPVKRSRRTFVSDARQLWDSTTVVLLVIKRWKKLMMTIDKIRQDEENPFVNSRDRSRSRQKYVSLTMNYELPRAASVGESVSKDERVWGLALDMSGPVTQEAIDTVREMASILASINPDPTLSGSQDGQTSSKPMTSQPIIR